MRRLIVIMGGVLVLALANVGIYQREQLLGAGRSVLLELAPVDPRSLMQGDYMALRFQVANDAFRSVRPGTLEDGRMVLAVDDHRVGRFKRFDDGTPIAADELAMRYRVRNGTARFATNAFFFQEGHGKYYAGARFGEFRVSPDGDSILTTLRDHNRDIMGPPR